MGSGKALAATTPSRRGKPRTPQQKRRAAADREYARLRASFLAVFNLCARCGSPATDLHHRKGRGPYYLDVSTWTALCRNCHRWVGTHPAAAIAAGLSEPRLSKCDAA